ncbi:hypothetical protein, partial [Capnocytophaga canis]|uniref:hypothetical protein n=1 Tax=Capnocytophaga canis TaxID=1848903 RepID=UPI001BB3776A
GVLRYAPTVSYTIVRAYCDTPLLKVFVSRDSSNLCRFSFQKIHLSIQSSRIYKVFFYSLLFDIIKIT